MSPTATKGLPYIFSAALVFSALRTKRIQDLVFSAAPPSSSPRRRPRLLRAALVSGRCPPPPAVLLACLEEEGTAAVVFSPSSSRPPSRPPPPAVLLVAAYWMRALPASRACGNGAAVRARAGGHRRVGKLKIEQESREREKERGRDTGRESSRLHAGSRTWDSILGSPGSCSGPKAALNC